MTFRLFIRVLATAALVLAVLGGRPVAAQDLNLYTTREPGLIEPLIEAFTGETGIRVNSIFIRDGLSERVAAEGARSPADVLMTVDFGNLLDLVENDLTQPVDSAILEQAIPANLRGENSDWFTLSMRAGWCTVAADLDLSTVTYEQLSNPAWRGRVCIRSGQHPYNTALIAAHMAHHGEEATEAWLRDVAQNLGRTATGGDRDVARDILGGICDIGIANSYYVGLMRSGAGGPDQERWGAAIKVLLPTFENGGTHVNISGAAVARNALNRASAVRFLEYLVSDDAQRIYAEANYEYPVKAGVMAHPIIAALGPLEVDTLELTDIARNRDAASRLVDRVGFDD